jgi:hypothetical protein
MHDGRGCRMIAMKKPIEPFARIDFYISYVFLNNDGAFTSVVEWTPFSISVCAHHNFTIRDWRVLGSDIYIVYLYGRKKCKRSPSSRGASVNCEGHTVQLLVFYSDHFSPECLLRQKCRFRQIATEMSLATEMSIATFENPHNDYDATAAWLE